MNDVSSYDLAFPSQRDSCECKRKVPKGIAQKNFMDTGLFKIDMTKWTLECSFLNTNIYFDKYLKSQD